MKKGITSTLAFELEIQVSDVEQVIFTFKEKVKSEEYLLQKEYPSESVIFEDNKFKCKLTQEETDSLSNTFFVEAQINLSNKSVIKSDICKKIMPPTLWTTFVEDNESSGNEEIISLTFTDYVEGGGSGGTTNYNELSNKPRFNGIEWVGNKTDSDMGIATKGELQTKADKSDTYTKEETNTLLGGKQDNVSGGSGIKIENDEISVDKGSFLTFVNNTLSVDARELAENFYFRGFLANTTYGNALASRTYVDNLMSGATKWEFVSQLPTENIDIHTIYFVPKESAETDNIYDEWVYAIQSRNPDVYDWELLGTSQVDLSNYYTKTESDNKYQLIIDSSHKVSADNIDDSQSTNKFTNATEKTYWNNKPNVFSGNGKPTNVKANYPNIKIGDYYINMQTANNPNILWVCTTISTIVYWQPTDNKIFFGYSTPFTDYADLTDKTNLGYISVGSIYIKNNDGAYVLTDNTSATWVWSKIATANDLSSKQDTIDSTHKLSADLVDDTNSTNKFVSAQEKQGWNAKADDTVITTDTTSTTVSLTLADNHEYRYTQDLSSLTLTMPSGDFIASVVFASGSTPTSMTYDSNIKWSGDDVTNGQFVPSEKTYNIVMWYDGLNINGVVRGVS